MGVAPKIVDDFIERHVINFRQDFFERCNTLKKIVSENMVADRSFLDLKSVVRYSRLFVRSWCCVCHFVNDNRRADFVNSDACEFFSDPPSLGLSPAGQSQSITDTPFQQTVLTGGLAAVFLTVMSAKQTKTKKKPMTLDDFAVLIQKDFARMATKSDIEAIRAEMATKEEIRVLRTEMRIGLKNLNDDVKNVTDAMVSKADLANTLAEELAKSPYGRQIADLQTRVHILERKLGVKPTHRAA